MIEWMNETNRTTGKTRLRKKVRHKELCIRQSAFNSSSSQSYYGDSIINYGIIQSILNPYYGDSILN